MKRLAVLIVGLMAAGFTQGQDMHKGVQEHGAMHGAVKTLDWPAMSMTFAVRDKALLEKLQPRRKVEFQFVQEGKSYVITGAK